MMIRPYGGWVMVGNCSLVGWMHGCGAAVNWGWDNLRLYFFEKHYKNFVKLFSGLTIMDQRMKQNGTKQGMDIMKHMNQDSQKNSGLHLSRRDCRNTLGRLSWVFEHLHITTMHEFSRVSLPDKGERVGRRGRKATGQGWALIAGLPKEELFKRQRLCQDVRAY